MVNARLLCGVVMVFQCMSPGLFGQAYQIKKYNVRDRLPTDIVKGCAQDQLGYFWIVTDEGLVKFDGLTFTPYRQAMKSNYAKGFLQMRSGTLLAYGDLDIIEIQNLGDTVLFKTVCPVSRVGSDAAISYPKLMYEARNGDIWVSESQAVVKLHEGKLKRYDFDLSDRTPVFLRSFSFFEDKLGDLYTCSYQGNVFKRLRDGSAFERTSIKFPGNVESVTVLGNELIIGCATGIYASNLLPEGGITQPEHKLHIPGVAYVTNIQNDKLFVATHGTHQYTVDPVGWKSEELSTAINNVNHVYVSREDDLCISSNDGYLIVHENLFMHLHDNVDDFIESVTQDYKTDIFYYATSASMYSYERLTGKCQHVMDIPGGYFQSLLFTDDGLWIANSFNILRMKNGKAVKEFDFTSKRLFVTCLTKGRDNGVWVTVPGDEYAYLIDSTKTLKKFSVPISKNGIINMVRESNDTVYVASSGPESYLFRKAPRDTAFVNTSVPTSIALSSEFNVVDVVSNNKVWLATSEGLFVLEHKQMKRIDLGEQFTTMAVKAISFYGDSKKIILANAYGLLLYDTDTKTYDVFNEGSGLPSNTITPRGIFVGNKKKIWVSTAKGLCYDQRSLETLGKTPLPRFIKATANGKTIHENDEINYGSYILAKVSCITFPENDVVFQYKLSSDSEWQTTHGAEISFSSLPHGQHTIAVRGKKNGPYEWSEVSMLTFSVAKPFWLHGWFMLGCIVSMGLLVLTTTLIANSWNRRRREALRRLVDQRTSELHLRNEQLSDLNEEKNNLIGIVAHDLKSPLNQVAGLVSILNMTNTLDDESKSYVGMIDNSMTRLREMVTKILDVAAIESQTLNLTLTTINFSTVLNEIADRYAKDAEAKNIKLVRNITSNHFAEADRNYLSQVIENLVSNAIKFSPYDRHIYLNLAAHNGEVLCEIKDEGPGLTTDDLKKLFGKYQKLSARPTGNESSTGLGLSIVKKFVDAMNGKIWCVSEIGKGASFFVTLKGK